MEKKHPHAVSPIASVLQPSTLLTPAQAAAYLGLEVATLAVWRCTSRYQLPYLKVGRLVRYRQSDLDTFLNARSVDFVEENQ